jgi:hypothetical protein
MIIANMQSGENTFYSEQICGDGTDGVGGREDEGVCGDLQIQDTDKTRFASSEERLRENALLMRCRLDRRVVEQ